MAAAELERLLAEARDYGGGDPSASLVDATSAFNGRFRDDASLLGAAAAAMKELPPAGAGWVAVALGAAVERGASAEFSAPSVFDLVKAWTTLLVGEPHDDEDTPRQFSAEEQLVLDAFPNLARSAVSHLGVLPELRRALGADATLMVRLEELSAYSVGAAWLSEALSRTSGRLIALHVESATGLVLQYTNVSNCFLLFTLLQDAIGQELPGGRKGDTAPARQARGECMASGGDEAWWHYGSPTSRTPELATSIWGEQLVSTIPSVDDEQVILLWPPIMQARSWGEGFLGPHLAALPASVTIERELSEAECQKWISRLGLEEGATPSVLQRLRSWFR